jgi:hemerythrin
VEEPLRQVRDHRRILQGSWLFGEMVSFPLQVRIARAMERRFVKEDDVLAPQGRAEILLLDEGLVSIFLGAGPIENLTPGGFFGEETVMRGAKDLPQDWRALYARPSMRGRASTGEHHLFEGRALLPSTLYAIPAETIEDIPVVQWKLMETYERRLKSRRAEVRFLWNDSYVVGIPEIDEQHRLLFDLIESLASIAEGRSDGDGMNGAMGKLVALVRSHLQYEETLPMHGTVTGYEAVVREHAEFVRKVEGLSKYLEKAPVDALPATVEYLKDWVIDHALVEHRRFRLSRKP